MKGGLGFVGVLGGHLIYPKPFFLVLAKIQYSYVVLDMGRMEMNTEQDQIALKYLTAHQIIEDFNFEAVHAYMKSVDWVWAFNGGVPSIIDLQATGDELLRAVIHSELPCTLARTGGLAAYKFTWPSGSVEYRLAFEPFNKSRFLPK